MTDQEIIQLKLSSGEEVLCEIVQWDDDHNATILAKNAFEIVFLQSPTGAIRLCTLRPFMVGQIEEGYNQPNKSLLHYQRKTKTLPNGFKRDYGSGMSTHDFIFHMNADCIYNKKAIDKMAWFDHLTGGHTHTDFFAVRPTDYSKANEGEDFEDIW